MALCRVLTADVRLERITKTTASFQIGKENLEETKTSLEYCTVDFSNTDINWIIVVVGRVANTSENMID